MQWLLSALKPLLSWFLSLLVDKIYKAIKHYIVSKEKLEQREAALEEKVQDVVESGSDPKLTEAERMKEQEDAWKRFTTNKP
jgi:cell division septum initiation protein DivIVA